MKNKIFLIAFVIIALAAGVIIHRRLEASKTSGEAATHPSLPAASSHDVTAAQPRVPAYQAVSETRSLPPTLAPAQFAGKVREAYKAAQLIPQTLAQLPCYCHCDQSFGHKSLHSCFEDNHASQCAVCVDEALLAYRLEKEQRLSPEQVRRMIIEKYSAEN